MGAIFAILGAIPWVSVIGVGVKLVNWMIDRESAKSAEKAATMSVLNTHMKGALNEIATAKSASDSARTDVAVDPDGLRNVPSEFNADNPKR